MFEVYEKTTRGLDNIVTIRKDSRQVSFPGGQKFCLASLMVATRRRTWRATLF